MNRRIQLQEFLETSVKGLKIDPKTNRPAVYFQPPESIRMVYPCIVYALDDIYMRNANNAPYLLKNRYRVTIIDKNPDSNIPNIFLEMPFCRFNRFYVADNLNHWVFLLFF